MAYLDFFYKGLGRTEVHWFSIYANYLVISLSFFQSRGRKLLAVGINDRSLRIWSYEAALKA